MRVSSIGHLTGVQLPYGIHLTGVRLGQACGSHRTYISQTCALDRRATLTGHTLTGYVSHGRSDFGANGQVDTNCPYCPPQSILSGPFWHFESRRYDTCSNTEPKLDSELASFPCAWIVKAQDPNGAPHSPLGPKTSRSTKPSRLATCSRSL
jgi:hypothetical protein